MHKDIFNQSNHIPTLMLCFNSIYFFLNQSCPALDFEDSKSYHESRLHVLGRDSKERFWEHLNISKTETDHHGCTPYG